MLFIAISWLLASVFTRKIRELSHSMEKIQTGQFDVYIAYPGNDEIGHLINGFNVMARKLKELVEEVFTIKIKEKEWELKALQAQINPHFLYNTLASISMLGMRAGGEDITLMSNSLAKFYKIALSKGSSIIKAKDEVEHVKAYMDIQGIRFKYKIKMVYNVDESVLEAKTLKLMLQPFIENSIGHGLWKDKKSITVILTVKREEDQIIWKITDDGVGISKASLEAILHSDEDSAQGYGIVNVDQRIKLYFGDRYGVSIFSRPGIGTTVTINTPVEM
jgi:two-component system sensor histidine kinase YesM